MGVSLWTATLRRRVKTTHFDESSPEQSGAEGDEDQLEDDDGDSLGPIQGTKRRRLGKSVEEDPETFSKRQSKQEFGDTVRLDPSLVELKTFAGRRPSAPSLRIQLPALQYSAVSPQSRDASNNESPPVLGTSNPAALAFGQAKTGTDGPRSPAQDDIESVTDTTNASEQPSPALTAWSSNVSSPGVDSEYQNDVIDPLPNLDLGFAALSSVDGSISDDYFRGSPFHLESSMLSSCTFLSLDHGCSGSSQQPQQPGTPYWYGHFPTSTTLTDCGMSEHCFASCGKADL